MLRLGKKIRRYITGICRFIRNDQNLAGACDGINAHITEAGLFGKGYKNVAGACDFIHLGDTFRAEGHGSDCLGASRLIDFIHSRNIRSRQRSGIHFPVGTGRG